MKIIRRDNGYSGDVKMIENICCHDMSEQIFRGMLKVDTSYVWNRQDRIIKFCDSCGTPITVEKEVKKK